MDLENTVDGTLNKFERNQVDTFEVKCKELGTVKGIRIGIDGKGLGSDWFLERVSIWKKTMKEETFKNFFYHGWLDKRKGLVQTIRPGTGVTYRVVVSTGDVRGAGTDSGVFLTLVGELGRSSEVELTDCEEKHLNKFERGAVETFLVRSVDLGTVKLIRIGIDGKGLGSDWYLEQVSVQKCRPKTLIYVCP